MLLSLNLIIISKFSNLFKHFKFIRLETTLMHSHFKNKIPFPRPKTIILYNKFSYNENNSNKMVFKQFRLSARMHLFVTT